MENQKEYVIYITETLQKKIIIKAEDVSKALEIAQDQYNEGKIELDYNDYLDVDIRAREK